jgi:hypothetical protein
MYKKKTEKSGELSLYTVGLRSWTAGVRFPAGARGYCLLHSVQTGFWVHPTSYTKVTEGGGGLFSPGIKRSESEAGNSPPSSAEVKNGGAIPATPSQNSP